MKRPDENDLQARRRELMVACESGDVAMVQTLLAAGVAPAAVYDGENSPLIMAADGAFERIVQLLIGHGADPNYKTDIGETALACAVASGSTPIVRMLLEAGADPRVRDRAGHTISDFLEANADFDLRELLERVLAKSE